MARGKSKNTMTTEELIILNQEEITETKEKLDLLTKEKSELVTRKKNEELAELVKTLETAGINVPEAIEIIKNKTLKKIEKTA